MQRLRIRYAKRGRLRFTSHRDFSRAFERAVFRARIPMAYSSGFNPHPRISYAGAAPTGSASEAEYLEIAPGRGRRPRRRARARSTRRCPTGSTWSRWSSRPAAAWPTCSRRAAGAIGAAAPPPRRSRRRWRRSSPPRRCSVRADDQEGAARLRLPRGGASSLGRPRADGEGCRARPGAAPHRPAVRPDDVLAGLGAVAGLEPGRRRRCSPGWPGTARPGDRRGRRPAAAAPESVATRTALCDTDGGRPARPARLDPTTFSPSRRTDGAGTPGPIVARPRRGPAGR